MILILISEGPLNRLHGGWIAAAGCLALFSGAASAHGFAGKRFFPATLVIEDSFVAPELDFLYNNIALPGEAGGTVYTSGFSTEFAKPLTRRFQLSIGAAYLHQRPAGGPAYNGFDNVEVGAKYQVFIHSEAESALAAGVDVDLGGTGSRRVGAESFSAVAPAIYYSKGFGNASNPWLRPFAITTRIAPTFPTRNGEPHTIEWGFTLQYSLPYLEDFVRDTGLKGPFRNVIPIIEFPMETCLDHGCAGTTTGTANPGFVWIGKYQQLGLELTVPVNHASGTHIGFLLQYHLYLDDIIPSWSVR